MTIAGATARRPTSIGHSVRTSPCRFVWANYSGLSAETGRRPDPKTFVPTVPVVQWFDRLTMSGSNFRSSWVHRRMRSVQAVRTGTLFKFTRDRSRYCVGLSTTALSHVGAPRKRVRKEDANLILTFSTNAKPPLPLRYFFCANSLAASAAKEKSKIAPAGTSPLISFQRIWKISFHVFSYFGNSLTSSMVSM